MATVAAAWIGEGLDLSGRTVRPGQIVLLSWPFPMLSLQPQALILDFDGVIVESVEIKAQAFVDVYRHEAPEKLEEVLAYQHRHGGVSRREKFRYFEQVIFGRTGDADTIDTLSDAFRERVLEAVVTCPFVAGARSFLARSASRLPLHLVSGTPHEELLEILERRNLARYFVTATGGPTTKRDAFGRILREHNLDPARVLAVGDALTEFQVAVELGLPFVGIVSPFGANPFPPGTIVMPTLTGLDRLVFGEEA